MNVATPCHDCVVTAASPRARTSARSPSDGATTRELLRILRQRLDDLVELVARQAVRLGKPERLGHHDDVAEAVVPHRDHALELGLGELHPRRRDLVDEVGAVDHRPVAPLHRRAPRAAVERVPLRLVELGEIAARVREAVVVERLEDVGEDERRQVGGVRRDDVEGALTAAQAGEDLVVVADVRGVEHAAGLVEGGACRLVVVALPAEHRHRAGIGHRRRVRRHRRAARRHPAAARGGPPGAGGDERGQRACAGQPEHRPPAHPLLVDEGDLLRRHAENPAEIEVSHLCLPSRRGRSRRAARPALDSVSNVDDGRTWLQAGRTSSPAGSTR